MTNEPDDYEVSRRPTAFTVSCRGYYLIDGVVVFLDAGQTVPLEFTDDSGPVRIQLITRVE